MERYINVRLCTVTSSRCFSACMCIQRTLLTHSKNQKFINSCLSNNNKCISFEIVSESAEEENLLETIIIILMIILIMSEVDVYKRQEVK